MALPIAGPDARPLLASQPLRTATSCLIALAGIVLGVLVGVLALFAESPLWFGCAGLFIVCAVATAAVTDRGWRKDRYLRVEQAGIALVALIGVAVAVYAGVETIATVRDQDALGTAPSEAAWPLALLALALLGLALLGAVLPLGSGRGRRVVALLAAATTLLALLAGGATAAAAAAPSDSGCDSFDFQPERWQVALAELGNDDASHMAQALDRCDVIPRGTTRERALALLGRPQSASDGSWSWSVGEPGGFSFGEYLSVSLTEDRQRVESVYYYVD